jgi:Domain of unknown function (DUF6285)
MQQRPDVATTLDAILRFLLSDVHPTVTDKGLQFRVLVAVNALSQCAAELRAEPSRSREELARLRALLPDVGVDSTVPALVAELDRALAERLRDGRISAAVDGEAARHLERSLRATLEATNPRFDLSDTIE